MYFMFYGAGMGTAKVLGVVGLASVPAWAALALAGSLGSLASGLAGAGARNPTPAVGTAGSAGASVAPGRDIPAPMLGLYERAAATCPGLDWVVLAGIGKVETDHGRAVAVSSAGAEGPMQFMPATWAAYGTDADGDGVADITDPADAVFSAARMLCVDGAGDPATVRLAVWDYNHSAAYVDRVMALAAAYSLAYGG